MTLIEAIKRSINTIAVKLSVTIGNGNAKLGRSKIVKNAKAMGLRTPLPDTPSLPIGADDGDGAGPRHSPFPISARQWSRSTILDVRTRVGLWRRGLALQITTGQSHLEADCFFF